MNAKKKEEIVIDDIETMKKILKAKLSGGRRERLKKILLNDVPEYVKKEMFKYYKSEDFRNNTDPMELRRLSKYSDAVIEKSICMSLSWLVAKILQEYTLPCIARRCVVLFMNDHAVKILREEGIESVEKALTTDDRRNTWTVGLGYKDNHYDGENLHAVIQFADKSVLDMTASQASRPQRDMEIKNYWTEGGNDGSIFPDCIYHFEFTEDEPHEGAIIDNPRLTVIANRISRMVAETLGMKRLQFIWHKKDKEFTTR